VKKRKESENVDPKEVVYYHRSYRKIPAPEKKHFIPFLLLIVLLEVLLYFFFPDLNHLVNRYSREILIRSIPAEDVQWTWIEFLWTPMVILTVPGSYPEWGVSLVHLLLTLAVLIGIPRMRTPKPIAVTLSLTGFIHLVSALFFLIIPERFPYQVLDFSKTYTEMVVLIWFLIPAVYGLTLYPLPASLLSKMGIILCSIAFSAVFHLFRYAVFLYVLNTYSFLFMAVLFFCFGILLDLTWMVGFYSFYLSLLSRKLNRDMSVWQWLY
jgi:hypothetical protein